jgi:tetratricopeptide (TPR) repeat protein
MAVFAAFRARRLARRAQEHFGREGFDAAAAILDGAKGLAAVAWAHFAVNLYNREHKQDAERAIRRALVLEPGRGDALIFLAELLAETGRAADAAETYRNVLRRFPRAAPQALALAKLLLADNDVAGARDLLAPFADHSYEILMLLAKTHYALAEHEAVVALLGPTMERMRADLKQGMFGAVAHRDLYGEYQEASQLYGDSYAALHGREKVIESPGVRADLDPRSASNYRLLGEARMADAPPWKPDTRLRSVEEEVVFGRGLIDAGETSRGLCHLGVAQLRGGRVEQARKFFDDARDADDDNFAAYLGLAACLDVAAARAFRRLKDLPDLSPPALIERVIIDWPALTPEERKVVALVVAPVAGVLERIVAAGAIVRLLPIDARLTDLPGMETPPHERAEDHRCLEAITGAATSSICASKIEELLCLTGERDSVFAHELAHLVHFHLPEPHQQQIDELFERALDHEHVATDYQTTNSAEFFAVAYTDFIAHEYGLPSRRLLDDEGIVAETFALIRTFRTFRTLGA